MSKKPMPKYTYNKKMRTIDTDEGCVAMLDSMPENIVFELNRLHEQLVKLESDMKRATDHNNRLQSERNEALGLLKKHNLDRFLSFPTRLWRAYEEEQQHNGEID